MNFKKWLCIICASLLFAFFRSVWNRAWVNIYIDGWIKIDSKKQYAQRVFILWLKLLLANIFSQFIGTVKYPLKMMIAFWWWKWCFTEMSQKNNKQIVCHFQSMCVICYSLTHSYTHKNCVTGVVNFTSSKIQSNRFGRVEPSSLREKNRLIDWKRINFLAAEKAEKRKRERKREKKTLSNSNRIAFSPAIQNSKRPFKLPY